MLSFKCPQCNENVSLRRRNFKQWRSGIYSCNNCGAKLKLSNGVFLGGGYGLCCGCLIVSTKYWGFGSEWIRLVIIIPVCWFFWSVLCRFLGHWRIVTKELQPNQYSPRIKRYSRFEWLSFVLSWVALFSTFLIVRLQFSKINHICSTFEQAEHMTNSQLLNEIDTSLQTVIWGMIISFGLFLFLSVTCIIFSVMKNKEIGKLEFAEKT